MKAARPLPPTGLFPEEVGVAAVVAHVAVEHVVGHEGQTGPVGENNSCSINVIIKTGGMSNGGQLHISNTFHLLRFGLFKLNLAEGELHLHTDHVCLSYLYIQRGLLWAL